MQDRPYLETLAVNADLISSRGRFYELYAQKAAGLDQHILTIPSDVDTASSAELRAYPRWLGEAARAEALARASQYGLLGSLPSGLRLLEEAGLAYAKLGVPFGFALLATVRGDYAEWPAPIMSARGAARALISVLRPSPQAEPLSDSVAEALKYPTQQTYLFMSIAVSGRGVSDLVVGLSDNSLLNSGAPIGSTGNTVGDYWRFIESLVLRRTVPVRAMIGEAFGLAASYAHAIRRAQRNRYAWERLQAPVDILDLDVVMLAVLLARNHEIDSNAIFDWAREHDRDLLEAVPIAIGCDIAAATGGLRDDGKAPPKG